MGFDLKRFTNNVDSEFYCPICHFVVENAMESHICQHIYCDQCIKTWLSISKTCPVDKLPLDFDDLKPITRTLRNLLMKLEIKCDFETEGCEATILLENLEHHMEKCEFNPNLKITCDMECGLEMTVKHYKNHNCLNELSRFIKSQRNQIRKQVHVIRQQFKQISSLKTRLRQLIREHQWLSPNGFLTVNENNEIECQNDEFGSFAQSKYPLRQLYSYVEIKIIDLGVNGKVGVGLFYCSATQNNLETITTESFRYNGFNGKIYNGFYEEKSLSKWENGDLIGCGVKFPNVSSERVLIYFNRNNALVGEIAAATIGGEFYPFVFMNSFGAKIIANFKIY